MLKEKNYISEHNSNSKTQVIISMISNREGWHYLLVKNYLHY